MVLSGLMLWSGWPVSLLPDGQSGTVSDFTALLGVFASLAVLMLPLDLLGGYLLPSRRSPGSIRLPSFVPTWLRGVLVQGVLFSFGSLLVLSSGRAFGLPGATFAVFSIGLVLVAFQFLVARCVAGLEPVQLDADLDAAIRLCSAWGYPSRPIVVVEHDDPGFTGGVVGLPGRESIVVAKSSIENLPPEHLAATIARRLEAIRSGSRGRGIAVAFAWVIIGFVLSASLPGAGVSSVRELVTAYTGFTLWTFLGLLTLPTLSRQASYAIDAAVVRNGVPKQVLSDALDSLDRVQDDEPERAALIEAIFHPVPSVGNRDADLSTGSPIAWHAARMTLFVSWACSGMLVRAVHCNVGRPELWVMFPTD